MMTEHVNVPCGLNTVDGESQSTLPTIDASIQLLVDQKLAMKYES